MERIGEILPILGEAPVSSEPRECALDHPSARQDDKSAHIVGTFDDLQSQAGDFGDSINDLMCVVAAIGPDQFEPRMALADLIEHQCCAIAILDAGGMNNDADRQSFGVDEGVNLAALHFLAGIISHLVVATAPFSADLSD